MSIYAIIETGGEQLRVEPGRFYDICHFASLKPNFLDSNTKILIYRVLMIRHKSIINIGHPWLKGAIIKGRILHSHLENKITVYKMNSKKKTRRKFGHRQSSARFVVDSIYLNGKNLI
uniref:Large ribosomal subunit protein bL21c n=1 Tax=Tetraphis pellucida TaxID=37420 RepID=A0A060D8T5_9BRYO|nr:ribosomal protein L21 [Tetraphis pellucida]AIB08538.1 ribosomal protein L21 [Tetraphis pellucida]QZJ47984.1 ribosomal protein L21 [Tetraphis pellucida]